MEKQLKFFLGYAESANYAGAGEWYVAKAENIETASDLISEAAESHYYEEDNDQIMDEAEDYGFDPDEGFDGPYASVLRLFEMNVEAMRANDELDSLQWLSKEGLGNSFTCVRCAEKEVIAEAKKLQLELAA